MARETKTVQCYPDDRIVNERIRRYESFGWELIGNQRCQEFEGQTTGFGFDGSSTITNHYSTFNKLTFTREKNSPWYDEVTQLEREYEQLMAQEPVKLEVKKPMLFLRGVFAFIFFAWAFSAAYTAFMVKVYFMLAISAICLIGGILIVRSAIKKKRLYNYAQDTYYKELSEWRKTAEPQAEKIMQKASAMVNR